MTQYVSAKTFFDSMSGVGYFVRSKYLSIVNCFNASSCYLKKYKSGVQIVGN